MPDAQTSSAAEQLQQEATTLLQTLIRFNTVNPPGAERAAQEHTARLLQDAGFEVTLVGRLEDRPNLVATLRGAQDGPTLCLLSHMDTVLANPAEWQRDPWSGDVDEDGMLWGRGALDMKSQTAAEVTAAVALARSGWRPARGTLKVVVVVDEEVGGAEGAVWICEHHPELVYADELLNEGAGPVIPYDGTRHLGVCVAEKGVFRFDLITDGVAGHASIPRIGDNALLKVAPLLARMAEAQPAFDLTEGPRAMLAGLGLPVDGDDPTASLEALRATDPVLAMLVEPMLGVTLAPTKARASEKINVIPSRAEIRVDCRVPPGLGAEQTLRRVHELLGGEGYRLEFTEQVPGNSSPVDTPLMDAIRAWVEREDPGTRVIPTILPGFTDSRTWRSTFPDCVAYGFFPHRHMTLFETAPLIHSKDERIDVRDLGYATRCYADIVRERLG
ncbi:M20/M25/M40 family metallo-hydrolase [Conexibacter sp. W3-3-2]|uniref:M20/M25/M40 family metallo-hydrolase n=1 Tax=Conexibacter sp. W3-3-2 TaxID=2675227 RepID=UPI0012B9A771|nr:M20/M25/M40 family metallo-hydrolase [Conexibacter sp. W3-3-2]MTD45673.1 M20/M25/M40 family metallo-hydrolase [Conexibacter sp. W3-3-2]